MSVMGQPRFRSEYPGNQPKTGSGTLLVATNKMSIVQKWRDTVDKVTFKGSWFCSGHIGSPAIRVNQENIYFPIVPEAIERMKAVGQKAPFGRGTETIVDDTVRKGLQLDPSMVEFCSNDSWRAKLELISQELRNAYQRDSITLQLYKLLIYEEGGHFSSHKDTLRDKTHIASLLITLPVEGGCEGGVLRVTCPGASAFEDRNEVMQWDGRCDDLDASWCSFYTDCQHELLSVTAGKRLVLAYQVYSHDEVSVKPEVAAVDRSSIQQVMSLAFTHRNAVVLLLKHLYPLGCEAKHLKGKDRTLVEFLLQSYRMEDGYKVEVQQMTFSVVQEGGEEGGETSFSLKPIGGKAELTDPITETTPGQRNLCGDAVEDDEVDDGYESMHEFKTRYFNSPTHAFLFNTDEFATMQQSHYHCPCDHTGNESAPGELSYQFYGVTVRKMN